jgi:hypothetical protein
MEVGKLQHPTKILCDADDELIPQKSKAEVYLPVGGMESKHTTRFTL